MIDYVIHAADMNLHYGKVHLEDIPPERFCEIHDDTATHPAWIAGHICVSYGTALKLLGLPIDNPPEWEDLFGIQSRAVPNPQRYPEKKELMKVFGLDHIRLAVALRNASPHSLEHPVDIPELKDHFKTVGDLVVSVMTTHEGIHLGQLSVWRRAAGMTLHV